MSSASGAAVGPGVAGWPEGPPLGGVRPSPGAAGPSPGAVAATGRLGRWSVIAGLPESVRVWAG
ncbi:hypothetical protein GCM10009680_44390 [Streptomyces yatensis]|uniref:Uncharacterized protein n=1 Tax=Streptomyces yatensis TaxID=155177 RepID=A0ABN2I610_9ACTN